MELTWPAAERSLIERIVRKPQFRRLIDLPLLAWQELLIVFTTYSVVIGGGALYLHGLLPYPLVLIASGIAIYAVFTPLHDATHRSVSRHPFLNDLIGTIAAQPLLAYCRPGCWSSCCCGCCRSALAY